MTFVSTKLQTVFHGDVDEMSKEETVASFALVNKVQNAVARRVRELRKKVDVYLAEELESHKSDEEKKGFVELVHLGMKVIQSDKNFGGKVISEAKTLELLAKKGIAKEHVLTMPPPPIAYFTPSKVEAMRELGMLTQEEYESCLVDVDPSYVVNVEVEKVVDVSVTAIVLGKDKEPPRKK